MIGSFSYVVGKVADLELRCSGIKTDGKRCGQTDTRPPGTKEWYCSSHRKQALR